MNNPANKIALVDFYKHHHTNRNVVWNNIHKLGIKTYLFGKCRSTRLGYIYVDDAHRLLVACQATQSRLTTEKARPKRVYKTSKHTQKPTEPRIPASVITRVQQGIKTGYLPFLSAACLNQKMDMTVGYAKEVVKVMQDNGYYHVN